MCLRLTASLRSCFWFATAQCPVVHMLCRPLEAQMANLECNATSAVQITHLFLQKMVRCDTVPAARQRVHCQASDAACPFALTHSYLCRMLA